MHSHQSNKPPLFIPPKPEDCDDDTNDEEDGPDESNFSQGLKNALRASNIDFETTADSNNIDFEYVDEDDKNSEYFTPGWACYPKREMGKYMSLASMTFLNTLYVRGNTDKAGRVTADRARIDLITEVNHADWYEQAFCTETRIKAFFSAQNTGQLNQINKEMVRLSSNEQVPQNTTDENDDDQMELLIDNAIIEQIVIMQEKEVEGTLTLTLEDETNKDNGVLPEENND